MSKVTLTSSDKHQVEVEVEVVSQSTLIKRMLEDLGHDDTKQESIPLPNVSFAVLQKVIEWCRKHKDDPPFVESEDLARRSDDIPEWDVKFLKTDQAMLFDLILAANYLDVKGLLDVCCKTVANMMKGKSVEELRKMFNIKNDFTPEEEEQIRKETAWCED